MTYLAYLMDHQEDMTAMLRTAVGYETPSCEKAAIDRFTHYLGEVFRRIGAAVEVLEQANAGNHVRATWGEGTNQALILCHMDTVWPSGEIHRRPFRIENGKAYGPGVLDMKGGIVQAVFALQAIVDLKKKIPRKIVFLLSSDEEIGSGTSRRMIEKEALKSDFVLVPEPAAGIHGAVKLTRKGWGMFEVQTNGRSAHAGNDHAKGINAVEELAHQIIKLQAMTNYDIGTTISVGEARGGNGYNIVPDKATCKVDLRASTDAELMSAQAIILGLIPVLNGSGITVSGGINRPPLEATQANAALYQKARMIAGELGYELPGAHVGGVSDGNFTSAAGVATLDGIGAVGDGPHAVHEHVILSAMAPRAALIAGILAT